jgi:MFS family permease
MPSPSRTLVFVNAAHAFVHYAVLIYPTAVIAIGRETGLGYQTLIPLATGGFVAFGLLSLPAGWLADRFGRSLLLTLCLAGTGLACLAVAAARGAVGLSLTLLLLGSAAALYHPVGLSLLAGHSRRYGRDLGIHGVCGNVGAAAAAAGTALLADALGWRGAFIVPGAIALALALAHWLLAGHGDPPPAHGPVARAERMAVRRPWLAVAAAIAATLAGGMTYTVMTVALPKIIDERYGTALPLQWTGLLATAVFLCGAAMQVGVGGLIDRTALPLLFVALTAGQLLGLSIGAAFGGPLLLLGLALAMAAIYGQVVVDDAIIARFVPGRLQGKAYGISYGLGFGVSALAVPLIGALHAEGAGFGPLLALAAGCAGLLFAAALGFRLSVGGTGPLRARR